MASADMFPNVSFSDVNAAASQEAAGKAVFGLGPASGAARLSLVRPGAEQAFQIDLSDAQIFKLGQMEWLCVSGETEAKAGVEEKLFSRAIKVVLRTEAESKAFSLAFQRWKQQTISGTAGESLENGSIVACKSKFDTKIEASSAQMYFHYYGQLLHQQNMLQDFVRTGTYYAAVMENRSDFEGKVVVDVGAGSGILSLFAAQAGAKHVYAVEASEMVEHAQRLISGNPSLGQRITIIKGKVEEVELPEKADILISEPMGTLLVNERMLESYVIARDRFLAPDGKMFPTTGRIHMAPFSDEYLYVEMANKSLFWQQHNFFGVDLTPLHGSAFDGYFSQPVVDAFDPRLLISPSTHHTLDFTSMKEEDLYEIDIPLSFVSSVGTRVHGLACWFDVLFNGSTVQRWLTTAPGSPTTHWYQLRTHAAPVTLSHPHLAGNPARPRNSLSPSLSPSVRTGARPRDWRPASKPAGIRFRFRFWFWFWFWFGFPQEPAEAECGFRFATLVNAFQNCSPAGAAAALLLLIPPAADAGVYFLPLSRGPTAPARRCLLSPATPRRCSADRSVSQSRPQDRSSPGTGPMPTGARIWGAAAGMGCFGCFAPAARRGAGDLKPSKLAHHCTDDDSVADAQRKVAPDVGSGCAHSFTFKDLLVATGYFNEANFIGEGGFGKVYKGKISKTNPQGASDAQMVAVKQLARESVQGRKEFLVEVLMLTVLSHPNLVSLVGFCAQGDERLLVYEYMPFGSLESHLFDVPHGKPPLDWNTRVKIAVGVAEGLSYLHNVADPPIIYRDMKAANILLDEDFSPKLSDFGLAKVGPVGDRTHVSTRVMGTYGYCAPDYVVSGKLTMKSDIYSFGVLLLELITGRRIYDASRPKPEQSLLTWSRPFMHDKRKFHRLADPALRGSYPPSALNQLVVISIMCLQDQPHVRPIIADVAIGLNHVASQPYVSLASLGSPAHSGGSPHYARTPSRRRGSGSRRVSQHAS